MRPFSLRGETPRDSLPLGARVIRHANGCGPASPSFFALHVTPSSLLLKTPRPNRQAYTVRDCTGLRGSTSTWVTAPAGSPFAGDHDLPPSRDTPTPPR